MHSTLTAPTRAHPAGRKPSPSAYCVRRTEYVFASLIGPLSSRYSHPSTVVALDAWGTLVLTSPFKMVGVRDGGIASDTALCAIVRHALQLLRSLLFRVQTGMQASLGWPPVSTAACVRSCSESLGERVGGNTRPLFPATCDVLCGNVFKAAATELTGHYDAHLPDLASR